MHRLIPAPTIVALAITILASPASAVTALQFNWTGTDENSDPFDIQFVVTDAVNGDPGYTTNNFTSSFAEVFSEQPGDTQIITDVQSSILGGSFNYPASPYFFVFVSQGSSANETFLQMTASANTGNIGLSFGSDPIEYLEVGGELSIPFVDPSTASSLSDLLPVGTYSTNSSYGLLTLTMGNGSSNADLTPTNLTISQPSDPTPPANPIPEPATAGLLGLAAIGLLARRRPSRRSGRSIRHAVHA